jgi:hypothetical protein
MFRTGSPLCSFRISHDDGVLGSAVSCVRRKTKTNACGGDDDAYGVYDPVKEKQNSLRTGDSPMAH